MSTRRERLNGTATEELQDDFLAELNEAVEITAPVEETLLNKAPDSIYFESDEDFKAAFKKMNENSVPVELTGEMLTHKNMIEGQPYNFFFMGYATIADKVTGEPRKAARLINEEKESFICASLVVLTALEKIEQNPPVAVRLISLGMKEGKKNNYWNVKVFQL